MARKPLHTIDDAYELVALGARLVPGPGRLDIDGTTQNDKTTGTSSADFFDMSQGGHDTVRGLAGDDYAYFGDAFDAKDKYVGGAGYDEIDLSGSYQGLTVTGTMLNGIEAIFLIAGGDYSLSLAADVVSNGALLGIYGDTALGVQTRCFVDGSAIADADLLFFASSGDNTFIGGGGNDYFRVVDGGSDVFDGGAGHNRISLYGAADGVAFDLGETGVQSVGGSMVRIHDIQDVSGTTGADTLHGTGDGNWIIGSGGNDRLYGLGGDDLLDVGPGGVARAADGYVDGGRGFDIIDFFSNGKSDGAATVSLAISGAQDTGQGIYNIVGIEGVSGTTYGDTLTGNSRANALFGSDGEDHLLGGNGNDRLYGDARWIVDTHGNGTDGPQTIDVNRAAAFADILEGGGGRDLLDGGGGGDILIGGIGADTLTGGRGNDTFDYTAIAQSLRASTDLITDFATGDRIDVSRIDADTSDKPDQAFHLGATAGHTGDIVVLFDAEKNVTTVNFFVDNDGKVDMTIDLTGNVALDANSFVF